MNFFLQKAGLLLIFLLTLEYTWAQNRIIGGQPTTIRNYPHMLRLQVGRKTGNLISACGASIIGKEWALTAAHCFDNKETDYNKISVIAGTANIKKWENTAKLHKVIRVIRNSYYGRNLSIAGDIAVMKVSPAFTFNNFIQAVKLPQNGVAIRRNTATITGWGNTWPKGQGSDILLAVTVPEVKTPQCKLLYSKGKINLKIGEICYGFNDGKTVRDKCQGDSGGPLVTSDKIEIGLVSYGVECGTKQGFPGVYTDVLYFRNWIKQQTGI